ncbi:hypothetical protein WJX79_008570 [Trebouxia sp. C0005]
MASDRNWGQVLLIGAGIVAAGGALWYLYSSQESAPRTQDEEDTEEYSEETLESSTQQPQPETEPESEPEGEPLKNRLPPLPERPTAAQRRASKAASKTSSKKEESPDAKKADSFGTSSVSKDSASTGVDNGVADEAVLEWFQTLDEVIVLLLVSANADSQHVSYKLKSNHLEVKERGVSLIQADLPFPVQVEESNWQFDEYQGQKIITVTLQKVNGDSGYADWPHYKTQA